MYEGIQRAHQVLVEQLASFNSTWPGLVVDGRVWQVPLLNEQKTPDVLEVQEVDGQAAIALATAALASHQRDVGQAAGTVMRLPGYFRLQASVLPQVLAINASKQVVTDEIEALRLALGYTPEMRPRLLRRALGAGVTTKQLQRTIHAFDGAPRRISFTWAGHTTSNQRIPVATVREQLQAEAESRAQQQGIPLEQTPEYQDLRTIANLADDQVLIKHKVVAPHPRCTLWFGERGDKWDAIIKANLPVFVLAGEAEPKVSALRDFDRAARGRRRGDVKARAEVWAERNLYLPTGGQRSDVEEGDRVPLKTPSTYRLGGITYESTA